MGAVPTPSPAAGKPRHSLRYVLLRVLAAVAVAAGALAVDRLVLADGPSRDTFGARVWPYEIDSELLDRSLPARVVVPASAPPKDRTLLVFLHGRGDDERSYLVDPMFEALAALGGRAPVVAFPYGGGASYWHDREGGEWATYVRTEVIPELVRRFDVDPDRVAIGGISMGGFGAYDIARLDPSGFCAAGGHSPALWEMASETADGAFDDAEDFARNDVISIAGSDAQPYTGMRLWLDAGEDDPFLAGDRAFEEAVRQAGGRPVVTNSPGGHDSDYWDGNWDEYLGFYAHALRHCDEGGGQASEDGTVKGDGSSRPSSSAAPRGGDRGAPAPGAPADPTSP